MTLTTSDPFTLRLLMNEDVYHVNEIIEPAAKIAAETVAAAEPEEVRPDAPVSFNYMGDNDRFFLLIVDDKIHTHASPSTVEALTRILKGMKLELKDIALMNINKHYGAAFNDLKSFFACSKLVLFGIDPKAIGLKEIPVNSITLFENVKVLVTYSFSEMNADDQKKRTFWNEMKKL